MSKPTIILIPGAWSTPDGTFYKVTPKLEAQLYPWKWVKTPSVGAEPPNKSLEDDVKAIHDVMFPLFEEGKDAILVAHSYAGIPAVISTKDHGIEERKKRGEKGGIKAILFLTAFAIPKRGMNLLEAFGGVWPPWMVVDGKKALANGPVTPGVTDAPTAFYSGVPEKEFESIRNSLWGEEQKLPHHCIDAFLARVYYVATDLTIPSTYLVCKNDQLLPQSLQDGLVASVPGMKRVECETGHAPMLSEPEMVAELIMKVASES